LLIFLEYERSRRKEIQKQVKEAAERQGILDNAREERTVGGVGRGSEAGGGNGRTNVAPAGTRTPAAAKHAVVAL
jgi:hypothetical protein